MPGFALLFSASIGLLLILVAGALVLPAPWSWTVGFAYIVLDTGLLAHHLRGSVRAMRRSGAAKVTDACLPGITILVAAYNEGASLTACVDAVAAEPGVTVVVADDGSEDGSADALAAHLDLGDGPAVLSRDGRIRLLRLPHAGKAGALNQAIAYATGEVVVTVDADTVLADGAITAVRQAFAAEPGLVAACGVLTPTTGHGTLAPLFRAFQAREYERAFFWRLGWADSGSLVLVSGAFAAYRRAAVVAAGGFDTGSLVEDYELMYRLHDRHDGVRAVVLAGARATTDVPGTPLRFLRQRARWFAGFLLTLFRYRGMVGATRLGRLGTRHLRLKTLDTLLPLWGLVALAALAVVWWRQGRPDPLVLWLLLGKAGADAILHAATHAGYRRWLGLGGGPGRFAADLVASLPEQLLFQPLRQLGAVLGWLLLLRRPAGWRPQRSRA